jgi:hypothetical protein
MKPLLLATLSSLVAVAAGACGGGSSEGSHASTDGGTTSGTSSGTGATGSSGGSATAGDDGGETSSSGTSSSGTGSSGTSSGAASSGGTSSGGDAGGGSADGGCIDKCPAPNDGVTFGCEKRFLFGVNYAWKNWGSDFGGGGAGVAGNQANIKTDLMSMQSHGVDVIRWWMFQELNGNGMALSNGIPTGQAAGTLVTDIQTALSLAAEIGVHYNFTLFSFDDFHIVTGGQDIAPIITNAANLAKLESFIALVAQTVESDPNKDRVVSWDVINEPEWAIGGADGDVTAVVNSGQDPYGDPVFNGGMAGDTYDLVTFAQMESFVKSTVTTLHAHSSALVTVGSAAVKWKDAWQHVGLDYYTVHMYDWINQWYPYNASVSSYGFTIPVVMGEFPNAGLSAVTAGTGVWTNGAPAVPYDTMLTTIFGKSVGYAGAMSWAYNDMSSASFYWSTAETNIEAFTTSEPCVTAF